MNVIETLREALHQRKVEFDQQLAGQPLLEREQRLARWEIFLAEVKPLAVKLAQAELRAEQFTARRVKRVREYELGAIFH
jgi:hypothetical protein